MVSRDDWEFLFKDIFNRETYKAFLDRMAKWELDQNIPYDYEFWQSLQKVKLPRHIDWRIIDNM